MASSSPRFEPILSPPSNGSVNKDKDNTSPLGSLVGKDNMILLWTGLLILLFVAGVVFYFNYSPDVNDEYLDVDEEYKEEIIDKSKAIDPVG